MKRVLAAGTAILVLVLLLGSVVLAGETALTGEVSGSFLFGEARHAGQEDSASMFTGDFTAQLIPRLKAGLEFGVGDIDIEENGDLNFYQLYGGYMITPGIELRLGYQTLTAYGQDLSGFKLGARLDQKLAPGTALFGTLNYSPRISVENSSNSGSGTDYLVGVSYQPLPQLKVKGGYRSFDFNLQDDIEFAGFFVGGSYQF